MWARGDQAGALATYRAALAITEKVAATIEETEISRTGASGMETASAKYGVARFALLARDFGKALAASNRARALAPEPLWPDSTRAHALMFLKRTSEARELYLAHKGHGNWEKLIAEDYREMREAGLSNPMMAQIESALSLAPAPARQRTSGRREGK